MFTQHLIARLLISLLAFSLSFSLSAQYEAEDSVYIYKPPVDETQLTPLPADRHQELIKELDYSGEPEKKEGKETTFEPDTPDWLNNLDFAPLEIGRVGTIILILLLAAGLGYFIYNFLEPPAQRRSKAERDAARVDVSEIQEEKLTLSQTESLLERAVRNEQYELAIRLQYLALLKRLHEMKMIRFAKDKVNLHYLREMERQPRLAEPFRRITHNFERNWYGRYPIDPFTYRLVADTYDDFHEKLDAYQNVTADA